MNLQDLKKAIRQMSFVESQEFSLDKGLSVQDLNEMCTDLRQQEGIAVTFDLRGSTVNVYRH